MYIPEALVCSMESKSISGLYIYCEPSKSEAVCKFFTEKFQAEWDLAVQKVIEEWGSGDEDDDIGNPATVSVFEKGVYVYLEPLDIPYRYGNYCNIGEGDRALRKTLKAIEKEFPGVSYEGYIAYEWSDIHSGEVVQYEIKSSNITDEKKSFSFVARALQSFFAEDLVTDDEDELKEILTFLYDYKDVIDCIRIFDDILDYAEEQDEDLRGVLEEAISELKTGKRIIEDEEDEEEDYSFLPDGYMDALEVLTVAEEYEEDLADEGILPELKKMRGRNEITTSGEESYPRIVYMAKQGDEKSLSILRELKRINEE